MNFEEIERIGAYRVKRFIAEGGMAWVFEVVDPRFEGFEVIRALKMLKPEAAAGEEFRRFQGEASLLAGIDHPNLVTIYEFGKDDATGCFFYTMTFIDGPTMAKHRAAKERLSEPEAVRLFSEVLGGLAELHRRKIVHRDIKPANVLIGSDGRARLADLGIARVEDTSGHTKTGFALGTVMYMSPEQARGRKVGPQSDVFSVGLTLYEALTGRIVYDEVDDVDSTNSHDVLGYLVHLARSGEELEIDFRAAGLISEPLSEVIRKACRFDPAERYATASEMREALLATQRVEPIAPSAPATRPPWAWIGGALVVLALAAFGGYRYLTSEEADRIAQVLARATALEAGLAAVTDRAAALDPPPGEDLSRDLLQAQALSQRYLADARSDFEGERLQSAESNADRAATGMEGICERLSNEYLSPLSQQRAAVVRQRVATLGALGAAELYRDEFGKLEKMLPAEEVLAAATCAGASLHLDRIQLASEAEAAGSALEDKLGARLPLVATEAHDRAVGARTRAESEIVDANAFTSALADGSGAMAKAEALREAEDFRGARDAYQEAVGHYEKAAQIAPAARARADALEVEERVEAQGGVGPLAPKILARAHDLYREQSWAEAALEFQNAKTAMLTDLDRGERIAEVAKTRVAAETRRTEAVSAGAERSAADALGQADEAMSAGAEALANDELTEAATQFQQAERLAVAARDAASLAIEGALESQRAAERDHEQCAALAGAEATSACAASADALGRGQRAAAALDAPTALAAFSEVRQNVATARAASTSWQAANQVAPVIASRVPAEPTVSAKRNERAAFSVEASDANGDPLRYEWSFEGNRLSETGATLEFPPQRSGTLEVAVRDEAGGVDTARWLIELLNTPPKASIRPSTRSIGLNLGATKDFEASVDDADGDEVDAVWKLDGQEVATGARYRFVADRAGRHELTLVATDTGGARTVIRRSIDVSAAPPTQAAPPPALKEAPAEPPPPVTRDAPPVPVKKSTTRTSSVSKAIKRPLTRKKEPVVTAARRAPGVRLPANLAIPGEWKTGVQAALGRYRRALVDKDMRALNAVWVGLRRDPQQSERWMPRYKGMFGSPIPLDVWLSVVSGVKSGDGRVTLRIEQTEKRGERTPRTREYSVEMQKRKSQSDWQITSVQ